MRRVFNNIRNHRNWAAYYPYKYFSGRKSPFTFRLRRGKIQVEIPPRMLQTYKECFFDQAYFKGFLSEAFQTPIKTVVDVGANVGYFSLFMLSRYPEAKVLAYEPMPNNFALLQKYQQAHSHLDLHPFQQAVSKKGAGQLVLHYDASDDFTTAATILDRPGQGDRLEVPTTDLGQVMADHQLESIDFLKLDCEGSEYDILYSLSDGQLQRIRRIAIETHPGRNERENTNALTGFLFGKEYTAIQEKDMIWAWRNDL